MTHEGDNFTGAYTRNSTKANIALIVLGQCRCRILSRRVGPTAPAMKMYSLSFRVHGKKEMPVSIPKRRCSDNFELQVKTSKTNKKSRGLVHKPTIRAENTPPIGEVSANFCG
jgi:hypothetical protein